MKRELVAIAFLILMLGFLFGNLRFLGDLVEEVEDAVSDAFFDLSAALREGEEKSTDAYLRLYYHLDSIERMDALRLSSIF